jgi:MSHA biogenesis protein MshN
MSLINKMLQDLDARGNPPGEAFPSHVKPVAHEAPRTNRRAIAAAVGAAVAVIALAWAGWSQSGAARAPASAALKPAPVAPLAKAPAGMTSTITMLPAVPAAPAVAPAPAPAPAVQPVTATRADFAGAPEARETPAAPAKRRAIASDAAAVKPARAAAAPLEAAPAKSVVPVEPDSEEARAVRRALVQELEARQARKPAANVKPAKTAAEANAAPGRVPSREQGAPQRAEGEYRRALASMQDGRMSDTIAALESALRIDPGHEAARQTLVGLLIEAHRPDDAIRQLQLGLTQDPRQPALAMLLARLQIERGGSGIETLTRTLPYAGANPDYHAFLAGALQRQQRHREAAAEYLAALRGAPANGVWWMGMGISLQAEKRNGEALDAFQKAQASGVLSAELQAFVERQIRQLGR